MTKAPHRVNIWNRALVQRTVGGRRLLAPPSAFRKTFQPELRAREFWNPSSCSCSWSLLWTFLQRHIGTRGLSSESWGSLKNSSKCPTSELTMKAGFFFSLLLSVLAQLSQAQYHYQNLMNYLESRMAAMEVRTYFPPHLAQKSLTKSKHSYLPSTGMHLLNEFNFLKSIWTKRIEFCSPLFYTLSASQ